MMSSSSLNHNNNNNEDSMSTKNLSVLNSFEVSDSEMSSTAETVSSVVAVKAGRKGRVTKKDKMRAKMAHARIAREQMAKGLPRTQFARCKADEQAAMSLKRIHKKKPTLALPEHEVAVNSVKRADRAVARRNRVLQVIKPVAVSA